MGADLIGYQTMFPVKFTEEELAKLNQFLDKINQLLSTPNLAKLVSKEESAEDTYLKQLNELVPALPNEMDVWGYYDDEEELKELIKTYKDLIPDAREFIESPSINERDSSSRIHTILGRKYVSVFAGEMSWGDEPQGSGYELLKDLDRVNLLREIEQLTIPNSRSIHFIKEE